MKTECIADNVKLGGKVYPCTVSLAMDLIGGKWKAVILYHLKDTEKRYNELRKEVPHITEMTLSLQLKQLEKDGLVSRKVYGKKPPIKVIYDLTDFGKTFIPVLEVITQWGNQIASEKGEFLTSGI
ncbi:helix-turn-helix transcriptional regulator [Pedobacter riviphilus]|uniref:Helix-turn-helix transcriptional regulator n=1 Tax=Pedobacter riviphilus TaxID=2766984 RepID=A0ABX6TLT5_9SPHI|nr:MULTISPECIES: helix-turn-helix domain-containing protein [Pedobacter]NII82696.1 DNA-binding HxlR family transcriptional regulator [Pedobacter sp. SG908]NMN36714.1 DNA-binding HxlR family transcriptional regulator [Pedobacter sp. SG918]QNR86408.1 helix-turn-helix transcriptional regulator [Pedobacter riviphilus]